MFFNEFNRTFVKQIKSFAMKENLFKSRFSSWDESKRKGYYNKGN